MSSVALRNHSMTIDGVSEVGDTYTEQAVECAREIATLHRDQIMIAHVDRFDGLVVMVTPIGVGWHFSTPLCGYSGTGPMATAEILEIFGFGTKEELYEGLTSGGDRGKASFYK